MSKGTDLGTRIALVAVILGLAGAYWLGAERAGELRVAVDGVRRHEAKLDEHERRLAAHDTTLAAHDTTLAAHAQAIAAARAEIASLKEEIARLKADADLRDRALAKLLERMERLERVTADSRSP